MTCSSCKYLKEDKKYTGGLCGAKYYCTKVKDYIDGSNCCSLYEKSYSRSNYVCDKIYDDGNRFSDDDRPISYHITILIMVIFLGLIISLLDKI